MTRGEVVYVLVRVVLLLGELLLALKWRGKIGVNFLFFNQVAFFNIVMIRVMPFIFELCIIFENWIFNQV